MEYIVAYLIGIICYLALWYTTANVQMLGPPLDRVESLKLRQALKRALIYTPIWPIVVIWVITAATVVPFLKSIPEVLRWIFKGD